MDTYLTQGDGGASVFSPVIWAPIKEAMKNHICVQTFMGVAVTFLIQINVFSIHPLIVLNLEFGPNQHALSITIST